MSLSLVAAIAEIPDSLKILAAGFHALDRGIELQMEGITSCCQTDQLALVATTTRHLVSHLTMDQIKANVDLS
jgi:hypothetical protein